MGYAFIVTHDFFEDKPVDVAGPRDVDPADIERLKAGEGEAFILLDDDRERMCKGRWFDDGSGRDPLMDYGMGMYGCTMLADGNGKIIIG